MKPVSTTRSTGQTLYVFPEGHSLADWLTKRVQLVEQSAPNTGYYAADLDESVSLLWRLFAGAAQPGSVPSRSAWPSTWYPRQVAA